MALMTEIIKKYEAQANKKIIEAREKREEKNREDGKELLDGVIINQGAGNVIPPAEKSRSYSIFKAPTNDQLYDMNVQERGQSSVEDTQVLNQQTQQAATPQSTEQAAPSSQHFLRQIEDLKRENRKLREQLKKANGQ